MFRVTGFCLSNAMRITDHHSYVYPASLINILAVCSRLCKVSRDQIKIYPILHWELLLCMHGKLAYADNHRGSFVGPADFF